MATINNEQMLMRRGPFDGQKFFSISPFRSPYFMTATIVCFACILLILLIIYERWSQLHAIEVILLIQLAWGGIGVAWWRALQHIDRVRQLFGAQSLDEIEVGSPLDIALAAAGGAINDLLFFGFGTSFFLLIYIFYLLGIKLR